MQVDTFVVGAGAAGIAATRRLHDQGHSVLLVEAMPRVGGRAHTMVAQDMPLDMGCGWLHSAERNPLARLAETFGFVIDRSEAAWQDQLRNLGFPAADQRAARQAYEELEDALRRNPPASDCAGDGIARDHPWRPYLDMLSGALNGAELDRVSARDLLAYDDHASEQNWRLPGGYGTLIAKLYFDVPADVQEQRMARRRQSPWRVRGAEDDFIRADEPSYQSALEQLRANTDTRWSPWRMIDADDEQQAALAALEAIADAWSKAMPSGPPQLVAHSG